jgi:hypothetical protein
MRIKKLLKVLVPVVLLFTMLSLAACTGSAGQSPGAEPEAETTAVLETTGTTAPAGGETPAALDNPTLSWHREGGIAGFCDDLAIYPNGQVVAATCGGNQPVELGQRTLAAEQLTQLQNWVNTFASFTFERTDEATADAMTISLEFTGTGTTEATDEDKQAIIDYAAEVYNQFSAAPSE